MAKKNQVVEEQGILLGMPEITKKVVLTQEQKDLLQRELTIALRGLLEAGTSTAASISAGLNTSFSLALETGDANDLREVHHQIDAIQELTRIRAVKSANRVVRSALEFAMKAAQIVGGVTL